MKITLESGKTLEGSYVATVGGRSKPQLMVVLSAGTTIQDAADMDGEKSMCVEGNAAGVSTTYAGYSRVKSIMRGDDGSIRVTLEKEE